MKPLDIAAIKEKTEILMHSDQRQMFLAVLKCLIPDSETMQVRVNHGRFREELLLMKYYGNKINNRSLVAAGAPVIFTNRNLPVILEEWETLFEKMTGKPPSPRQKLALFVWTMQMTGEDVKTALIAFHPMITDKKELIDFQKAKVEMILQMDHPQRQELLAKTLYEDETLRGKECELMSVLSGGRFDAGISCGVNTKVVDFLLDIRNFRIRRNRCKEQANPMAFIRFSEGEVHQVPLLGRVEVTKKIFAGQTLEIHLQGKSEHYIFRYRKEGRS